MNTNTIKQKLVKIFKNDIIEVIDTNGMNNHFSIVNFWINIVSSQSRWIK